jgi:serine/threonine/tyrosine-interacting protein
MTVVAGVETQDQHIKEIIQGPGDVEWKYEMRRECQEILPGLWLGPFLASKNLEVLQSINLTHMYVGQTDEADANDESDKHSLCIRDAKEAFSVKPRFPEYFQYMTLDVQDNEDQNLIRLFPGYTSYDRLYWWC